MNNTIAWVIVALAALVSAVALTSAIMWAFWEDDRKKAILKLILTAILFAAIIFLMGFLSTTVHL